MLPIGTKKKKAPEVEVRGGSGKVPSQKRGFGRAERLVCILNMSECRVLMVISAEAGFGLTRNSELFLCCPPFASSGLNLCDWNATNMWLACQLHTESTLARVKSQLPRVAGGLSPARRT